MMFVLSILCLTLQLSQSLREFRTSSDRTYCQQAQDANYPFVYSKYAGQLSEGKARVNSNLQDFRHTCNVLGGRSKCHICKDFKCGTETCHLQLQGVNTADMSQNIPSVSDTSWAVNGSFRHDYGGKHVTHFCVFTSGGDCIAPLGNHNYSSCAIRCFGHGFTKPAKKFDAQTRTKMDVYPGMGRWPDDGQVDLWQYPRNCSEVADKQYGVCSYDGPNKKRPSYNPQGYTFTLAGAGTKGHLDGVGTSAQFNHPEDVAVDEQGNLWVADTNNHLIRRVSKLGRVTTIAGVPGTQGDLDGSCLGQATFAFPKGLDVRIETVMGVARVVILVADTGNHRIRRIDYVNGTNCVVRCLTGLCGNNTLSATDATTKAVPLTGYADGSGLEARFSAPESVAFLSGDYFAIADTGNFLIRMAHVSNGTTVTLAGSVVPGETDPLGNPLAGCTPPCLRGDQGFRDGNLTSAQFYNPLDVTLGPNNTIWVADEQRVRIIELPNVDSHIYGIRSTARVSTIAGTSLQGHDDDIADRSSFFYSSGVYVTADNIAYVADAVSCRIRRVTPMPLVAQPLTCDTRAFDIIRPSGCTGFDQPIDKVGRKVSRVEGNVQYNYGWPYEVYPDQGKYIKNCVGVPPLDTLDKHFITDPAGDNLVVDDYRTAVNEDSEQGTAIIVHCPANCDHSLASNHTQTKVQGTHWYAEASSICLAAIHDGVLTSAGGIVQLTLERRDYLELFRTLSPTATPTARPTMKGSPGTTGSNSSTPAEEARTTAYFTGGRLLNGITSVPMGGVVHRVFSMIPYNVSNSMVHTVAGRPSAPLQGSCGFADGQPSTLALFSNPAGIASSKNHSLTDLQFLYVADAANNRIRAISATCTQICENQGTCVGPDTCRCLPGWEGVDCTKPVCSGHFPLNQVCVAPPNTFECRPGYTGKPACVTPTCVQECKHGTCTAPDTCSCEPGWFDTTCGTPVCSQTCANGGNCVGPDLCSCPSEWSGVDCRTPVCLQTCHNGGRCMAPNTCACPPDYTNYDCTAPVCSQGYFVANGGESEKKSEENITSILAYPTYKNCDLQSWCNATNEFECDQADMSYQVIGVPWGAEHYATTGREEAPDQCMNIELPIDYKIPFQLVRSDRTTTGHVRFSPNTQYTSFDANPWRGYLNHTANHTGPWTYATDRQVAFVNFLNVSQGRYVCANGGTCSAPNTCRCVDSWAGFDCRTPVCKSGKSGRGYYKAQQEKYVESQRSPDIDDVWLFEAFLFEPFLGNASKRGDYTRFSDLRRLKGNYSNPSFTTQLERYVDQSTVVRFYRNTTGSRYLTIAGEQGGYRCSIRADTRFENETLNSIFNHPNYYSRYMDQRTQADGKNYTFWRNMGWPPIHSKSRVLDQYAFGKSFAYTNEGWRRYGIWNRTANNWEFGVCVIEFFRNCSDSSKQFDLRLDRFEGMTQDTDVSFRPRITYNDNRVLSRGRWKEAGGRCVDEVIRGCPNNGTCYDVNSEGEGMCRCAEGWSGVDCRIPLCDQTCHHHGNCTTPNVCTCERGWTGFDCLTPMCAQECQNGGYCIAPDTCVCKQWPNSFRDGRVAGGRPLFQDAQGDPLMSGWTGYDCSVPICVQAEKFVLNTKSSAGLVQMGGHGADGNLLCTGADSSKTLPRCPKYDLVLSENSGITWQSGCGWDPYDTGCCVELPDNMLSCYKCSTNTLRSTNETLFCAGDYTVITKSKAEMVSETAFLDRFGNFLLCDKYHSPRDYQYSNQKRDYGVPLYYVNPLDPEYSNFNYLSNWTSNRFLCNVDQWFQGDYNDDAGLGSLVGAGSNFGLISKRHVRVNYPNIVRDAALGTFTQKPKDPGEGVYMCYNDGTCLAPDTCSCTDGYEGYDCNTPLCRHLQPSGAVSGCLNGGICVSKDSCNCVQTTSVLYNVHPQASKGVTGWTGTDCSMPMCVQGFFDPFCTDLPQAPGGEGCYRCSNGGNCTAPDVCTCAKGWTGFDCRTPVCEVVADPLTRTQLGTVSEDKVAGFESDPCGVVPIYGMHGWHGTKYSRGNCTQPNQCTCLCKVPYSIKSCHKKNKLCDGPWQDLSMVAVRNLLVTRGPEFTFGSTDCAYGYEGNMDSTDRFTTCHQIIYVPTSAERTSIELIVGFSVAAFFAFFFYRYAAVRLKKRFLLAKIERRRSKRSSEESLLSGGNRNSISN